jgi:hypothetical protein
MRAVIITALALALGTPLRTGSAQATEVIGGCVVITLRGGSSLDERVRVECQNTPAARAPNGQSFDQLYAWAVPFLAAAFDDAERGHCGLPGCATNGRTVRVVLLSNGSANAFVGRQPNGGFVVGITTGLLDFTEATSRALLQDAMNDRGGGPNSADGLAWWLSTTSASGGRRCSPNLPSPARGFDSRTHFQLLRTTAQTVYWFIFAHEVAHVRLGSRCGFAGAASDVLGIERECDRRGFEALASRGYANAMAPVAFLIAMRNYEALTGPLLALPGATVSWAEAFPARDWGARARSIVDTWRTICQQGNATPLCADGWRGAAQWADRMVRSPAPSACVMGGDPAPPLNAHDPLVAAIRTMAETAVRGAAALEALRVRDPQSDLRDGISVNVPGGDCSISRRASLRGRVLCVFARDRNAIEATRVYDEVARSIAAALGTAGWVAEDDELDAGDVRSRTWRKGDAYLRLRHSNDEGEHDVDLFVRAAQ